MKRKNHKLTGEGGAIVIEATLSVTFFMFVIIVMLNFVNICIAQARIGIALNQTAKEISQYTYFYSLSGLNEIQATLSEETEAVKSDVTKGLMQKHLVPENGVTDDGGHLIASQFGGSGAFDNLVAMSSKVNRAGGEWYNMEKEWANAVKNNGSTVEVDIRPYYEVDSQRPTGFIVSYVIDGVKITPDPIPNE